MTIRRYFRDRTPQMSLVRWCISQRRKKQLRQKVSRRGMEMTFEVWDYSEIVVVDPRYYAGNAGELMRDYEVDEVLFLYRVNTFTQDNHLYGFLE